MKDADVIDKLGGPAQLARRLGLNAAGSTQRVSNWKRRGIPAGVRLEWQALFASATDGAPDLPPASAQPAQEAA